MPDRFLEEQASDGRVIVVTAIVQRDGPDYDSAYDYASANYSFFDWGGSHGPTASYNSGVNTDGDPSDEMTGAVSTDVDPSNQDAANDAAENVARGIVRLRAELEDLNPNDLIDMGNGVTITVGEALETLNNARFILDDAPDYGNSGVGSAERGENGQPNEVRLNYAAFEGPGSYADSNYVDDEGLVGILLHEVGHVTEQGAFHRNQSESLYALEHGSDAGYIGSDYFENHEKFANDFAYTAADAFGESLSNLTLEYGRNWIDPQVLYNNNMRYSEVEPIFSMNLQIA